MRQSLRCLWILNVLPMKGRKKMNWDLYFHTICNVVSLNSKCLSRKLGAIVVRDKSIISTGYNGPPRSVPSCSERLKWDKNLFLEFKRKRIPISNIESLNICPRKILGYDSGEGLQYCVAGHAERNSLINAAREGISTKGAIMYMNCGIPCTPCLVEIINAGIEEIVVTATTYYDLMSQYLIEQSKLKVRMYDLQDDRIELSYICSVKD